MRTTLNNNSGHQNESLSPVTSGLMHSRKADARQLLTNFNLNFKRYPLYAEAANARHVKKYKTFYRNCNFIFIYHLFFYLFIYFFFFFWVCFSNLNARPHFRTRITQTIRSHK